MLIILYGAQFLKQYPENCKIKWMKRTLITDEPPYLTKVSSELPSELQHWIDSEKEMGT